MSARNTILNNLRAALLTIRTEAGYNTNIKTVTRDAENMAGMAVGNMPFIYINDIRPDARLEPSGTNQRRQMNIVLQCWVAGSIKLNLEFNKFVADIWQLIHAQTDSDGNCDLSDNAISMNVGAIEPQQGDKQIYFVQHVDIVYYYSEASP